MKFIREHKWISILTAVVVVLCLVMIISYKTGGNIGSAGGALEKGIATVQKPLSNAGNSIRSGFKGIFGFRQILAENEELKKQVSMLENEVVEKELTKNELKQLQELSNVFNYEGIQDYNEIIAANIVSLDGSNWFNMFTIDRGTESGIQKDCVVVNGDGLIGRVREAGNGWAKVVSIIDESNNVSFMVLRDMSLVGIVSGDSNGSLAGFMIDNEAGVIEGDILVTSNMGMYPAGIRIGKVASVTYNSDTQLKNVKIEPSVSFKSLQKVAVIL